MIRISVTVVSLLFCVAIAAQRVDVSGVVTDENGQPLSYTSIALKKSRDGTCADDKGRFRLQLWAGDSLRITRVGYSEFRYGVVKGGHIVVQLKRMPFVVVEKKRDYVTLDHPIQTGGSLAYEALHNDTVALRRLQAGEIEEDRVFTRVEIWPGLRFKSSLPALFLESVPPGMVRKKGRLRIGFVLTKTKTIDSVQVLQSYRGKVDRIVLARLKEMSVASPALQNGRFVDAYCEVGFSIKKTKGKVEVEIVGPE